MINHVEGQVLLKHAPVLNQTRRILCVGPGQDLRTEKGCAEVLFALAAYLRLGPNSEIEMVSAGLMSASIRLYRGSMIVDVRRIFDENSLAVFVRDLKMNIVKKGLYLFDNPVDGTASFRVSSGKAVVISSGAQREVKKKWSVHFSGPSDALVVERFVPSQEDELAVWSAKRAAVVADSLAAENKKKTSDSTTRIMLDNLPDRGRAGIKSRQPTSSGVATGLDVFRPIATNPNDEPARRRKISGG